MLWQAILDPQRLLRGRSVMPKANLFAEHGSTTANQVRWQT